MTKEIKGKEVKVECISLSPDDRANLYKDGYVQTCGWHGNVDGKEVEGNDVGAISITTKEYINFKAVK